LRKLLQFLIVGGRELQRIYGFVDDELLIVQPFLVVSGRGRHLLATSAVVA
jgi:hypothetical protein